MANGNGNGNPLASKVGQYAIVALIAAMGTMLIDAVVDTGNSARIATNTAAVARLQLDITDRLGRLEAVVQNQNERLSAIEAVLRGRE